MPRINASSVAEHRRLTTEAILDAAEDLLRDAEQPLSLATVGARVGLQRSSLYRYFAGVDDLVEAVAVRGFPRWTEAVRDAVEAAGDPRRAVAAYVRANLEQAVDSRHEWRAGLARLHLDEESRRRIGAMHVELTDVLRDAVRRVPGIMAGDRDRCADAVQALTDAGMARIGTVPEAGRPDHVEWYAAAAGRVLDLPGPSGAR